MSERARYLIIEDEAAIRRFVKASFSTDQADWIEAGSGAEGLQMVAEHNPSVVLLDLGLPDRDGLEVLRELRQWTNVPVIVLTARGKESDKVTALDLGADDYVTKPFSVAELKARIRVALRHASVRGPTTPTEFSSGNLRIDFESRQVFLEGAEVRLTPTEYRLLALLAEHAGKVLTHRYLLSKVWGEAFVESTHTLRVHMASLRAKIEVPDAAQPIIRTETGVGYRMLSSEV